MGKERERERERREDRERGRGVPVDYPGSDIEKVGDIEGGQGEREGETRWRYL